MILGRPVVVIAADVDPRLKDMANRADWDVWDTLDFVPRFEMALGSDLPPITWMLRADDSMRELTGSYASCYTSRRALWDRLRARGHELGWHLHHWSYGDRQGFDPSPRWLPAALESLSAYFPITSTRTGWDYCNTYTLLQLDALGITIDLSALPGHLVWFNVDGHRITIDWRRCPHEPYRPGRDDYQRPGADALRLIEVPITSFRATPINVVKRVGWRIKNGAWSIAGITAKTHLMTTDWPTLPRPNGNVFALYFHPDNLTDSGIASFVRNMERLRERFDPEFITGSECAARLRQAAAV